ncbi:MAG: prepilin-type N-terminal cleavage/methylation domain-containing protein [Gammaproteobacteria bacterium]|nr:prepilin-type N-terminal cleavage/methylation domain-containing protein [Gammaproteobacteria bacterium]
MLSARPSGFTLVELILTMMLISIAVLGITYALSFAFTHQSDGLWQAKSVALAESYIEEIMARRYDEVTPLGGVPPCAPATVACSAIGLDGEVRAEFDDVDDYDGIDDLPPVDVNGNPRAEYAGFRVQVSVAYADVAQVAALGLDNTTDAKLVTVTVTPPGQSDMSFPIVRGNY